MILWQTLCYVWSVYYNQIITGIILIVVLPSHMKRLILMISIMTWAALSTANANISAMLDFPSILISIEIE